MDGSAFPVDVTVSGHVYKINKIDVFTQDAIVGRLRVMAQAEIMTPDQDEQNRKWLHRKCLSKVQRQQPGAAGWVPVVSYVNNELLTIFDDIDYDTLNALVSQVLRLHLPNFFRARPAQATEEAMPTMAPAAPVALAAVRSS